MKRKALPLAGIAVIAAASLAGGYYESRSAAPAVLDESSAPAAITRSFEEALERVQDVYAGSPDLEALGEASIQGMLYQLDPHSRFFTKKKFDALQTEQRSRIFGIGVTIAKRYDRVYILSVVPGTPAHRAGLRYGDALVAIDGQNVTEWSSDEVMQAVRGERGEPVEITVERPGAAAPVVAMLKRDEVRLPSVRNAFMIQDGIGYVALTGGFTSKTDEELTEAMAMLRQQGMRQMILDLRGNPGGLLDQAIEVSKKFLAPGQGIVEVRGRDGGFPNRRVSVPERNISENMPMVILVNRYTASASEVVAGALQDHDRALIVGESSFGKGLVQSVFNLKYGAGLTLTTARYYTPKGRSLQRDYSKGSFYDYFRDRRDPESGEAASPRGDAVQTDLGRTVYSGGGITPDIVVKSPASNPVRLQLFYGIFDFTRQLAAGQVNGFRHYRVAETQYRTRLSSEDLTAYPITEELLAALRQHLAQRPQFNVSDEQFAANLDYVRMQLRREIISAAYGPEAGDQIFLTDDVQLRKAVESLDQARMLADNARRARGIR